MPPHWQVPDSRFCRAGSSENPSIENSGGLYSPSAKQESKSYKLFTFLLLYVCICIFILVYIKLFIATWGVFFYNLFQVTMDHL